PTQTNPRPDPEAEARKKAEQEAKKKAEEEAEKARKAAEKAEKKRLKEIERQRREARERAEQAAKARASWDEKGRPRNMITVRTDRVETVDGGRLTNLPPRRPGLLTLNELDNMVPRDWLQIDGDTATLDAMIVLTPGTAMEIGPDIKTLRLIGGPEVSDAASLYTGGGRLKLEGVTVSAIDRASQQPLPFDAAGRPIIEVSRGGELNAVDATITDMGMPELGQEGARPAVSFNPGSSGSLVRTTLQRNTIGVELSKSEGVKLDGLTVTESEGDGIVLNADQGTTMAGIRAERNGGNGMSVGGETTDRPITGITTVGNHLYGVVVAEQKGIKVNAIDTTADEAGGLRLNQAVDVQVTDFTATDQPIAIFTHVGSTGIVLDGIHVTGGRRGVVVEKSTTNLEMRNSTVEGSRVSGVNIGGKDIRVNGVQVTDAKSAVRVERGSGHIQLNGLTIDGGRDGIVANAGTEDLAINDLVANHVQDDAIRSESPALKINGGTITGGTTGIDVAAAATITGLTINAASEGLHIRSPQLVVAENVSIDTIDIGFNVLPGGQFRLVNSSVHALEAYRGVFEPVGNNNFSLPALNLIGAIGVPLILLAIVLEQVHTFRQRKVGGNKRRVPPAIPVGAT
ncbi:MAG: right-handed parallel beta-helix repeat-containing protein, partial [Pseudonocardia sp.]